MAKLYRVWTTSNNVRKHVEDDDDDEGLIEEVEEIAVQDTLQTSRTDRHAAEADLAILRWLGYNRVWIQEID